MADSDCADCRCSNISIMQLFHELKQRFPTIPDQIVSKVIEQNFHDKSACEAILQNESHSYVQCYPGALISGEARPTEPLGPLSDHCSAPIRQHSRGSRRQSSDSDSQCSLDSPRLMQTPRPSKSEKTSIQPSKSRLRTLRRQSAVDEHSCSEHVEPDAPDPVEPLTSSGKVEIAPRVSHRETCPDVTSRLPHTVISESDEPTSSRPAPAAAAELAISQSERAIDDEMTNRFSDSQVASSDPFKIVTPPSPQRCSIPRSRPLSLEEKLELAKIPLGQLVREVRERHLDAVSTTATQEIENSNGCDSNVNLSIASPPDAVPCISGGNSVSEMSYSENSPSDIEGCEIETSDVQLVESEQSADLYRAVKIPVDSPEDSQPPPTSRVEIEESASIIPDSNVPLIIPCDSKCTNEPSFTSDIDKRQAKPAQSPDFQAFLHPPPTIQPPLTNNARNRLFPPTSESIYHQESSQRTEDDTEDSLSTSEYQVAVKCVVRPGDSSNNQRSFTSVNLTLRPPSKEVTLPIEISSGQSLVYTSESFNKRKGYQSQLQIRIGRELLQQQKKRKDVLARELHREREKLRNMRIQVRTMEEALARKPNPFILSKLRTEISQLRDECERLTAAVDLYALGQSSVPLGETSEDFYRNIYTGQRQQRNGWSCRMCTFRNHPLLSVCEECEMPRLSLGISSCDNLVSNPLLSNNNSSCAVEETSKSVSRTIAPLREQ